MLEMLQNRDRVTGADLAARLGVDERTVRRYATTLTQLGIPVAATRGRYGGYRLDPGARVPPLLLTDNEAVAVVLGLAAADQLGMTTEAPAAAVALAKVHRLLPARLAPVLAYVEEAVGFPLRPRTAGVRPASPLLLLLSRAAGQRRRVVLSDRSWRGSPPPRQVDPYGVVFHNGVWYLTGHDHRLSALTTLRVDRIGAVDLVDETFTVPDGFDPVAYVARSVAGTAEWEVEVLLEADPVLARRRVPEATAELVETADGVLLRARVARLEPVAHLLAGLGWPFTILQPGELRNVVRRYAADLGRYAQRSLPDRSSAHRHRPAVDGT